MTRRASKIGELPSGPGRPDGPVPSHSATTLENAFPLAAESSGGPIRRTIRVVNPHGLHHRVADKFTRTAKEFASTVVLKYGDARADGKSLWDLILLVVLPDSDVVLEVEGPDAAAAVERLTTVLAAPAGEDYTI